MPLCPAEVTKMKIEITMPRLRPEMKSGKVCRFNVSSGDVIKEGEVLFELETDKVISEVEASADMKILSLLCEEGDEIECGRAIASAETL